MIRSRIFKTFDQINRSDNRTDQSIIYEIGDNIRLLNSPIKIELGKLEQVITGNYLYLEMHIMELFIESFVQEAYRYTQQSKKKTVSKRDVDNCIESIDSLAFLDGAME
ncbi:unnamed protein product, partial [Meganyctiphanes norvegica]